MGRGPDTQVSPLAWTFRRLKGGSAHTSVSRLHYTLTPERRTLLIAKCEPLTRPLGLMIGAVGRRPQAIAIRNDDLLPR